MSDDLDFRPQETPFGAEPESGGRAGKVASFLGVLLIVGLVGGAGYGIYRLFAGVDFSDPGTSGGLRPKYRTAMETEFAIDPPPLNDSRYAGPIDTYYLRGLDQARKLVALTLNRDAKILEEYVPGLEGKPRANTTKSSGPPGIGSTPKDVQDYYARLGLEFLDLPPDQVWGYDTTKRELYIGLRPAGAPAGGP
jgi:hypothetical protein